MAEQMAICEEFQLDLPLRPALAPRLQAPEAPAHDAGSFSLYDTPYYEDKMGHDHDNLPPREFWLIDPDKEKLPTPVDDRGFVIVPELIRRVKATIDPAYAWNGRLNVHHFYWYEAWYRANSHGAVNAQTFREMSVHKGLMPVTFHNWLHRSTEPAPVPDVDMMRERVESWTIAKDLFRSVREAVVWEKRTRRRNELIRRNPDILPPQFNGEDKIGKEFLTTAYDKHFGSFEETVELLRNTIPENQRFIDPDLPYYELAGRLGKLVGPKSMLLTREIAA